MSLDCSVCFGFAVDTVVQYFQTVIIYKVLCGDKEQRLSSILSKKSGDSWDDAELDGVKLFLTSKQPIEFEGLQCFVFGNDVGA